MMWDKFCLSNLFSVNRSRVGVTLIELLTVMSLMASALLFAVPSWHNVQENVLLAQEQQGVAMFLKTVQLKAAHEGRTWVLVGHSYSRQGRNNWCLFAQILRAPRCDCANPATCPADTLMYHARHPRTVALHLTPSYPQTFVHINGLRQTQNSHCFTLQAKTDYVGFYFRNEKILSGKIKNSRCGSSQ